MATQKVAPTHDQREYEEWKRCVLRKFSDKLIALFDDAHDQQLRRLGLLENNSKVDRLLRHLLRVRAFAEVHCAQTLGQRGSVSRRGRRDALPHLQRALPQVERDVQRIYDFLSLCDRARRYGIDLSRLSLNTFLNAKKAAALCEKLRKGVQREIRHALHRRLDVFLEATPIGGQSARQFDVEPLLHFALDKRLEHVGDEQLYALFVEQKMRKMRRALAEQGIDAPDEDLTEEQFELMRGVPAAPKPILTENNQICTGSCMQIRNSPRKMCVTAPYRKYGVRYTWDYCD